MTIPKHQDKNKKDPLVKIKINIPKASLKKEPKPMLK